MQFSWSLLAFFFLFLSFFPNVVVLLGMFKDSDIGMGQYKISLH